MRCKKTPCVHTAYMVKFLILTLCVFSSWVNAEPGKDNKLPHIYEEFSSSFWHWVFLDAEKKSLMVMNELQCLALNIYFEARSETIEGQNAVGYVVLNRVADNAFPDSICEVVKQGGEERRNQCQFSWWCDGRSDVPVNRRAWLESVERAYDLLAGDVSDPTKGALWYHAEYVTPKWSKALTMVTKIGQHLFYQDGKRPKYALN